MRIVIDLNRCQGYAQCVPLAPTVLKLNGEAAVMYDPNPAVTSLRGRNRLYSSTRYARRSAPSERVDLQHFNLVKPLTRCGGKHEHQREFVSIGKSAPGWTWN